MLEALADFDDGLLEKLLEDVAPDRNEIYRQLAADLAQDLIVPVFLGSAERDHGVRCLLKALRHETPEPAATAERLGIPDGGTVAQVAKVLHTPHTGRLSLSRVWRGAASDGMILGGEKVSGLFAPFGGTVTKIATARAGDLVALGRLEKAHAGDVLTDKGQSIRAAFWPDAPEPVHAIAVQAEQRTDEVKLTAAIHKLVDEDPSLTLCHRSETAEMVLCGQGPVHLGIATDRLRSRHNVPVRAHAPVTPYRESIRKGTELHSRFKRQSGGHGQFADIHVAVRPLPRGSGFQFKDAVVGGAVPRQFIPAVEEGCREALASGPMGFPVVDLEVTLTGGQYHAVDSSEQAFRTVGRQALQEALGKCEPVLLEPIMLVTLATPTEFTAKVQRLASGRRGQILGFDVKPGWAGWDEVKAYMPQADMADLIIELRSITLGLGSYTAIFDHLQELTGRLADRVAEQRQAGVAAQ
jgi:elongation factor G